MPDLIAIYPGSFDPLTNGHLDLIERSSKLFDQVVVAILTNLENQPLFTVKERVEMLESVTASLSCVAVVCHCARHQGFFGLRIRVADGADESQTRA